MSSIDQRIVQMRFDNKDFESNVGTTMSTLEKLKEKLKFTKSDEGIQNLKNSFNGFDFSAMQTGIDTLNDRFSVLGIAGMEVIRRLTNAAIDMGQNLRQHLLLMQFEMVLLSMSLRWDLFKRFLWVPILKKGFL